ncbi:hypothetical protein [Psychrobacillus sp. OK032]|uniref:hypothetical protein n=1 Tax=Psychrobacillus sp. OK032 TaxID=1884358 RepID=UPI0015A55D6A|nr:hypothetical protein [Psychrobacillus sp. OK032]
MYSTKSHLVAQPSLTKHPLLEQASYKSQLSSVLSLFFLSPKYFQMWYVDQNKAAPISILNGAT